MYDKVYNATMLSVRPSQLIENERSKTQSSLLQNMECMFIKYLYYYDTFLHFCLQFSTSTRLIVESFMTITHDS